MLLTKIQEDFIGSTFPTPKGGVLTVVGVNGRRGSRVYFELRCSICSEDEELWPKGSICSTKSGLKYNLCPCSCSMNPKLTEHQYLLKINRLCKEIGYEFIGYSEEYQGVKTHITLYNPKTGNKWSSSTIYGLLHGKRDKMEHIIRTVERLTLSDEDHINHFRSAGFDSKYNFKRNLTLSSKRSVFWDYTCEICSNDEFVKNNLCTGVFTAAQSSLKVGNKSCRCSKSPLYTQAQREFMIIRRCEQLGAVFKGWVDEGYKNPRSKFKIICSEGHESVKSVNNFINYSQGCRLCHQKKQRYNGFSNGFYKDRTEDLDYLYCILFKKGNYIKVGRSFNVPQRLRELITKSESESKDVLILRLSKGNHLNVYNIEQEIHSELTSRGFYHNESTWTIETFHRDCEYILNKLLDNSGLTDVPPEDLGLKC